MILLLKYDVLGDGVGPLLYLTSDVGVVSPSSVTVAQALAGTAITVNNLANRITITSTGYCPINNNLYLHTTTTTAPASTTTTIPTVCYNIVTTPATPPTTPQNLVPSQSAPYGFRGALIYNNYNANGTGTVGTYMTSAWWKNLASTTTDGPLNRTGLWTSTTNNGQILGFSACVNAPTTKMYYIGVGADNYGSIRINGIQIISQDYVAICASLDAQGYTTNDDARVTFHYWMIYPVTLTAGENYVEVFGTNIGGIATIGAEIYDATPTELANALSYADLSGKLLFSSKDLNGQPAEIGTDVGYTCPSGYALVTCDGPYYCAQKTIISCPTTTTTTTTAPPTTTTTTIAQTTTTTTWHPYYGCYGFLYNNFVVYNASPVFKANAHIPNNSEWSTLAATVGGTATAGRYLKEAGTVHWSTNTGANNSSGFTAIGSGLAQPDGLFDFIGKFAFIWSTDLYSVGNGSAIELSYGGNGMSIGNGLAQTGMGSIRLIMNTVPDSIDISGDTGIYVGIDGKNYLCILIGSQWWMAENLRETLYQDLSVIPIAPDQATRATAISGTYSIYNDDWATYNGCAPTTTTTTLPTTTTTTTAPAPTTTTTTLPPTTTTTTAPVSPIPSSNCNIILNASNGDIYGYDYVNNTTRLLVAGLTSSSDIAITDTKLWIYTSTNIYEYNIDLTAWTIGLYRIIPFTSSYGAGLVAINNTTLLMGGYGIYHLDISGSSAVVTQLFVLPNGGFVTGDIYYNPINSHYYITYQYGSTYNLGEFEIDGNLVNNSVITIPFAFGLFSYASNLYVLNTNGDVYLVNIDTLALTLQKSIPNAVSWGGINGSSQSPQCLGSLPTTTTTTAPTTTTTTTMGVDCYAYLYNFYALSSSSPICTINAHVPSETEWINLVNAFGGDTVAGGYFKEAGYNHWQVPNTGADNSSRLTILPGGVRYDTDGSFVGLGTGAGYWSATVYNINSAYGVDIGNTSAGINVSMYSHNKTGHSVRLIVDTITHNNLDGTGTYAGNDGKIYPCIWVSSLNQWWLASNLAETQYQDHSSIQKITDNTLWSTAIAGARCTYNNNDSFDCISGIPIAPTTTTTTTITQPTTTTTTTIPVSADCAFDGVAEYFTPQVTVLQVVVFVSDFEITSGIGGSLNIGATTARIPTNTNPTYFDTSVYVSNNTSYNINVGSVSLYAPASNTTPSSNLYYRYSYDFGDTWTDLGHTSNFNTYIQTDSVTVYVEISTIHETTTTTTTTLPPTTTTTLPPTTTTTTAPITTTTTINLTLCQYGTGTAVIVPDCNTPTTIAPTTTTTTTTPELLCPYCPTGYSSVVGDCFITTTIPATVPTTPLTFQSSTYSKYGTEWSIVYNRDVDFNGVGTVGKYFGNDFWINTGNTTTHGVLNRIGGWSSAHSNYQIIGVSTCITISETSKWVYFGIGSDNSSSLYINGIEVLNQNNIYIYNNLINQGFGNIAHSVYGSADVNWRFWQIYPIHLQHGQNIIELRGYNYTNVGSIGLEIYDATADELANATSYIDLGAKLLFTSSTKLTHAVEFGLNVGYTCPPGYTLVTCNGAPYCAQRTYIGGCFPTTTTTTGPTTTTTTGPTTTTTTVPTTTTTTICARPSGVSSNTISGQANSGAGYYDITSSYMLAYNALVGYVNNGWTLFPLCGQATTWNTGETVWYGCSPTPETSCSTFSTGYYIVDRLTINDPIYYIVNGVIMDKIYPALTS